MRRLTSACAVLTSIALVAACTEEAATPPEAVPPSPAPTTPATPPVSYACESGQSITVAYPDASTAQLSYKGQPYVLRTAQSASGARFVGSGVEWWIASRGDTESATLSRLGPNEEVGTAVLERCSRPSSGPVPTGPTPVGGGTPAVAPPCQGPQLRLTAEGGDAGAGNRVSVFALQNIGRAACSLNGHPGVTLQDAQGRGLTAIRSDRVMGGYFTGGVTPAPVELAPQDKAFFDIAWSAIPHEGQGERVCPNVARIRVTAPGDTSPVTLNQALQPCGGRVQVTPFRPVADSVAPAPEPTA
jgi:membrane-bound inhibitor of C-type lysozyme